MGKKISNEIIEQIPILYKELKTKIAVAEKLGISVSTVSRYLKDCDIEIHHRTKITEELVEEINEKYQDCKNISKVAKDLDISITAVRNHLNERSLELLNQQNDDRDALFFYIVKLFGKQSDEEPISKWNLTQMQKFRQQGYTYKGQLLSLKYFFEETRHSLEKSNGSIGIVPYVYQQAYAHYMNKAKRADDINKAIQKQLEQDRIEIKINPNDYFKSKKKKKTIDLNSIKD